MTPDEALVPNAELYESCAFADALAARLRSQDGATSSGSGGSGPGGAHGHYAAAGDPGGLPSVPEAGNMPRIPSHGAGLAAYGLSPHPGAYRVSSAGSVANGGSSTPAPVSGLRIRLARWLAATSTRVTPPFLLPKGSPPRLPAPWDLSGGDDGHTGVGHVTHKDMEELHHVAAGLAASASSAAASASSKEPKPWLRLDARGRPSTILADKHAVAARYGVPLRDLRLLDSALTTSFSAALLCRKRTIVINLEHVKMLVTHQDVFLPPTASVECAAFVAELRRRLVQRHKAFERQEADRGAGDTDADGAPLSGSRHGGSAAAQLLKSPSGGGSHSTGVLPFELCVLDCALEAACGALEQATATLEHETPVALDALGASIDAATLERVRQLKAMITRDEGRAQSVRGEILSLLDDDSDMRDCLLSRKAAQRQAKHEAAQRHRTAAASSGGHSGLASPFGGGGGGAFGSTVGGTYAANTALGTRMASTVSTPGAGFMSPVAPPTGGIAGGGGAFRDARALSRTWSVLPMAPFTPRGMHTPLGARMASAGLAALVESAEHGGTGGGPATPAVATLALVLASLADDADVQAVEDILETYFAQVDRTCARLGALEEHVGQTEQFVNIDLDAKRNTLIEMMLITAFMLLINSFYTTITGAFAMGLPNLTQEGVNRTWHRFIALNVSTSAIVVVASVMFLYIMRKTRIVQL